MSSLTLRGATGAIVGPARNAEGDEQIDIFFSKARRFVISPTIEIPEKMLRILFARFFDCGPTTHELEMGYQLPLTEERKEMRRCPPDIGFKLLGNVLPGEGFAVSWSGGWLLGTASGCLLPINFVPGHFRTLQLQSEIESILTDHS